MKKLLSTLFLMIVVGLAVAGVASYMSRKRLESKSDDEIREFLARKLEGRVGEEQLTTIQDAVIGGVRGKKSVDATVEDDSHEGAATNEAAEEEEAASDEDDATEESSEEASAE
jgi:hypothetical protein